MTIRTTQTKRLERSAHSSVASPMEISTSTPPMVGVPDLTRWVCGPSCRTAWPIFMAVSLRMTRGPHSRPMNSAVSVASAARSVR